MILTCPACTMRYLVAEGAIGPNGRRVRCANCGHQWMQAPEEGLDEELFAAEPPAFLENIPEEDDPFEPPAPGSKPAAGANDTGAGDALNISDEDFQSILRKEIEATPIPAGVHPDLEDPVLAQLVKDRNRKKLPSADRISGYITAAAIYLFVLIGFLMLQPQISRAWPPSNLLYDLVGMKPVMPGEGLSLDNLQAQMADGKITMKGDINNLKEKDVTVPAIMATIVGDDGKMIDRILIPPPIARIKGEGEVSFEGVYPKLPGGATNVTFAFSFIKVKPSPPETPEKTQPVEKTGETPKPIPGMDQAEPPKETPASPDHE